MLKWLWHQSPFYSTLQAITLGLGLQDNFWTPDNLLDFGSLTLFLHPKTFWRASWNWVFSEQRFYGDHQEYDKQRRNRRIREPIEWARDDQEHAKLDGGNAKEIWWEIDSP